MKALWQHYWDTTKHKFWIVWFTLRVCKALLWRGMAHDHSKYGKGEAEAFAALSTDFGDVVYGSPRYYERLAILKGALSHHYRVNRHHPEHHEGGITSMGILDTVEMLVDWKAASLRNRGGNITDSIRSSQKRFEFDEELANKYSEFFEEIL